MVLRLPREGEEVAGITRRGLSRVASMMLVVEVVGGKVVARNRLWRRTHPGRVMSMTTAVGGVPEAVEGLAVVCRADHGGEAAFLAVRGWDDEETCCSG